MKYVGVPHTGHPFEGFTTGQCAGCGETFWLKDGHQCDKESNMPQCILHAANGKRCTLSAGHKGDHAAGGTYTEGSPVTDKLLATAGKKQKETNEVAAPAKKSPAAVVAATQAVVTAAKAHAGFTGCSGLKKDGSPCTMPPLKGTDKCYNHSK